MATSKQTLEIVIRLRDLASKGLLGLRRGLSGIRTGIGKVQGAVFSLKGALIGLGAGLVARSFLSIASSFEQMEKQLDQLTKGKGTETLEELNTWAKQMPVNTQQAVSAFVQMQAFGLDPTLEKMEILTDIATVMGESALPRVSRALGQMAALGKVSGEELNQLSEIGINARGILKEAYGVPLEELQRQSVDIKEIIDVIWEGLAGQYGGASKKALDSWQGIMTVLKSYWTDFVKETSEAGLFVYMKTVLREILDLVQRFEKDGSLKNWSQNISDYGIKTINLLAKGIGIVGDAWRGWQIIWAGLKGVYATFSIGVNQATLAIMDNIKAVLDFFAPAVKKIAEGIESIDFLNRFEAATDSMKAFADEAGNFGNEYKTGLEESIAKSDQILLNAGKTITEISAQKSWLEKVNELLASINKKYKDQRDGKKKDTADEKKGSGITKRSFAVTGVGEAKAQLAQIQAATAEALVYIQAEFDKGTISAQAFYDAQVVGAKQAYQAEQNLLLTQLASEKKSTKKEAIQNKIVALESKHNIALFKLNEERLNNISAEEQKAYEHQKHLAELKQRELATTSSQSEITSVFSAELLALDSKHAEEIQRLRETEAEKALIKETYRVQDLEKEKLAADQKIRLQNMILDATSEVLGNTASAFEELYNATGKKTKEFFYIYKSAAIAQAIIDTYKGATSAYTAMAGIPYVGPALGIAAATAAIAAGIARVATIRTQSLAEGGIVGGSSPHSKSDNVPINATAGEFMQPVSAVSYYGKNVMESLRTKSIPRELLLGFKSPSFKTGFGSFAVGGAVSNKSSKASGNEGGSPVTINNIVDPQMMDQHLISTPGQRSVMNVISENKYELKQLVLGE